MVYEESDGDHAMADALDTRIDNNNNDGKEDSANDASATEDRNVDENGDDDDAAYYHDDNQPPDDSFEPKCHDDNIDVPDNDPSGSIYAFLNATAQPHTDPLYPFVAAALEDIYPTPAASRASFYATLRQLDPLRTRYRHLELLTTAAARAPHERQLNALAHYWNAHTPATDIATVGSDARLLHVARAAGWYRAWLQLLYEPVLVPVSAPIDYESASLQLRRLASVTNGIVALRRAESGLGAAELENFLRHAAASATAAAAATAAATSSSPASPSASPAPETAWIDDMLAAIPRAYAFVARAFDERGGGEAGLAAADTAYRAMHSERRLFAQLLATEQLVERVLARRHVEDMPLAERLHVFRHADLAGIPFVQVYALREATARFVAQEVRQIQHVAHSTAAYRYLRRTSCLRPWRALFLVVSDDAAYAGAAAAAAADSDVGTNGGVATATTATDNPNYVRPLHHPLAASATVVRRLDKRFAALSSSEKHAALQPLLLRPVARRDLPTGKQCSICKKGFAADQVMLQTWCNHEFHLLCIFCRWDLDEPPTLTKLQRFFRCYAPNCRQHADPPGAVWGLHPLPRDIHADSIGGDVRLLHERYRSLLAWQRAHPAVPLSAEQKAVRMAYWRRRTHRLDRRRSILGWGGGARAYDWHPLPLRQMYAEEGLPAPLHPPYVYDAAADRLVPANPTQQRAPMFRFWVAGRN